MASITYCAYVENFLRDIAQRGDETFRVDDLVDRIISDKRAQGAPVATNHRFFIRCSLLSEAQKQRIVLEGEGMGAAASFTASGLAHFTRVGEPHSELNSGVEQEATKGHAKRKLQDEYSRLATIVAGVVRALEGFEPPALLLDASNLPHLVRSNIVKMNYVEDIDILQNIRETSDRLGFALGW